MARLKVPSLQHLARNWHPDSQVIKRKLVTLARNAPTFNYNPLFSAVRDMLVLDVPYEQIEQGIMRGTKRRDVRENYLGALPLIRDHFSGMRPTFVQGVSRRYYPVGRNLLVPFDPPLIYGFAGEVHFPWFSFWRSNPIDKQRLSLFVTAVDDVLLQDPDLESAVFSFLDFSAPGAKQPRCLSVIDARSVERLNDQAKRDMLAVFAEGFALACSELENAASAEMNPGDEATTPNGPTLFDDDI